MLEQIKDHGTHSHTSFSWLFFFFFFPGCWSKNSFRVTFSPTIHDFIHQRERYLLSNLIPILRKVVSVFRVSSLLCEHLKSMHVVILECYVYFEQS